MLFGVTSQPDGSRGGGNGNGFGGIPGQGEAAGGRTRLSADEVLGVTMTPDGRVLLQTANGDVDASTAELEGGITADTIKLAQLYGKNGLPPQSDSPIAQMAYEAGAAERAEETRRAGETAAEARVQGADADTEGTGDARDAGTFKITDWMGYPDMNRPTGPFRIISGEDYTSARKIANTVNSNLHKQNNQYDGLQIHEIHPVKFGGSPTDISNKDALTPKEHAIYTTFWNRILKKQKGK